MFGHTNETYNADDVAYYRHQAEEVQQMLEAERQCHEEERQRRWQEIREQAVYNERQADDWRDALQSQASLFGREAAMFPEMEEETGEDWFATGADACRRGVELWDEVAVTVQPQIDELERQAAALRDQIRYAVGRRIEAEADGRKGWQYVADALLSDEYDDPSEWLNW